MLAVAARGRNANYLTTRALAILPAGDVAQLAAKPSAYNRVHLARMEWGQHPLSSARPAVEKYYAPVNAKLVCPSLADRGPRQSPHHLPQLRPTEDVLVPPQ